MHIGLEFDEMTSSLNKLLSFKSNELHILHMSWNIKSFWGINKNRGQCDVEYWLNNLKNVNTIILDRDYVFSDDDKIGNIEALQALKELLPHINIEIANQECTAHLASFASFVGLK